MKAKITLSPRHSMRLFILYNIDHQRPNWKSGERAWTSRPERATYEFQTLIWRSFEHNFSEIRL